MLKEGVQTQVLPAMDKIISELARLAEEFADVPMLSRTHGQSATPTTMGREMAVFAYRLAFLWGGGPREFMGRGIVFNLNPWALL